MAALDDDGEMLSAAARSYDINEMLGTKTRALMQREQGRDLYDLSHAWELSETGATSYAVDAACCDRSGTPISATSCDRNSVGPQCCASREIAAFGTAPVVRAPDDRQRLVEIHA